MTDDYASLRPINPGETVADHEARAALAGLRAAALTKAQWTHGAHLVSAVALLDDVGRAAAEAEMPGLIRRLNESMGGVNSDTEGYHHTITVFYLRALEAFLAPHGGASLGEKCEAALAAPIADRAYPLQFYDKAALFSVAARRDYLPPVAPPYDDKRA